MFEKKAPCLPYVLDDLTEEHNEAQPKDYQGLSRSIKESTSRDPSDQYQISLEASCAPSTETSSCANTPGISATAAAVSVGAMYSVGWQLVA